MTEVGKQRSLHSRLLQSVQDAQRAQFTWPEPFPFNVHGPFQQLVGVECKAAYEPDVGTKSPLLNVLKKAIKVLLGNHSYNIFGGWGTSRNTGFAGRRGAVGSRRMICFTVGKRSLSESELRFSGTDSQVSVRSDNSWIGPGRLLHDNPPTAKRDQGPKGTQ